MRLTPPKRLALARYFWVTGPQVSGEGRPDFQELPFGGLAIGGCSPVLAQAFSGDYTRMVA